MSKRLFSLALLAATIATPLAKARAADLDPGYADIPALQDTKVEFGTGWYIRGDIGVTHGTGVTAGDEPYDSTIETLFSGAPAVPATAAIPAQTITTPNPDGSTTTTTIPAVAATPGSPAVPPVRVPVGISQGPGQTPPSLNSGGSSGLNYTASLGAGYQFNRWFRADAIFDFYQPVQSAVQGQGRQCITGTAAGGTAPNQYEIPYSTTCTPTLKASLQSYDVLFNGYIDIGKWYSVTPYVGAGVGLSFGHAQASSHYIQGNDVAYNATYVDAINGQSYNQNWDRSQSVEYYNLAFALTAGFAIDIFDHTKLDISYRYLHLGEILGTYVATQEVRAGLRYMIDN